MIALKLYTFCIFLKKLVFVCKTCATVSAVVSRFNKSWTGIYMFSWLRKLGFFYRQPQGAISSSGVGCIRCGELGGTNQLSNNIKVKHMRMKSFFCLSILTLSSLAWAQVNFPTSNTRQNSNSNLDLRETLQSRAGRHLLLVTLLENLNQPVSLPR